MEDSHRKVELCLAALEAEMAPARLADSVRFTTARLRLGQANLARTQLAREACAYLLANGAGDEADALRSLQRGEADHAQMISQHVGGWNLGRVERDWRGYCTTTRHVLGRVREMIAVERRLLLPLLRQGC